MNIEANSSSERFEKPVICSTYSFVLDTVEKHHTLSMEKAFKGSWHFVQILWYLCSMIMTNLSSQKFAFGYRNKSVVLKRLTVTAGSLDVGSSKRTVLSSFFRDSYHILDKQRVENLI